MMCPKCDSLKIHVVDVRHRDIGNIIYRRRECLDCGYRFSTYELLADKVSKYFTDVFKETNNKVTI